MMAIAHDALPLYEAEAKRRRKAGTKANLAKLNRKRPVGQEAHTSTSPQRARDDAARVAGTSGRSVARFKRVADADLELADQVRAGTLTLMRAERIARDRLAEACRVAEAKAAARRSKRTPAVDLRHGDLRDVFADIADIADGTPAQNLPAPGGSEGPGHGARVHARLVGVPDLVGDGAGALAVEDDLCATVATVARSQQAR
jgi:hypothetical protein